MLNFNAQNDYTLEDERVLLRPLEETDFENLLPFALNEPETWEFSLIGAEGEDGMRDYIKTAVEARKTGKEYPFIVFDKRSGTYAGSTRFYDIVTGNNTTQLGFTWYGKNFRGTGLNRHCKFLLLQFAFETMGALRVEFRADADNARSVAAMKAIGCKPEGVLRSHMPKRNGGRRNTIVLSILKEEWDAEVKANLKSKLIS